MRHALFILLLLTGCADTGREVRGLGDDQRRPHPWSEELRPLGDEGPRFALNAREHLRPLDIPPGDFHRSLERAHDQLMGTLTPRPGRDEILGVDRRIFDPEGDIDAIGRDVGRFLAQLPPRFEAMKEYIDRVVLLRGQPSRIRPHPRR